MLIKRDTTKQKDAKELFQEQMMIFNYFDDYRKQSEEDAINCYKLLVGYKEEVNEDDNRSNLHIPRTYQIVDTIRARLVSTFFKSYPYLNFIPSPTQLMGATMNMQEEKAEVASALVNEQLKKNKIVAKFYDYLTSLLVFPLGILGVGWRYEEDFVKKKVPEPEVIQTQFGPQFSGKYVHQIRESRETIWDDNEIVNVDFFDFWGDPRGSDIDNARGVFQREFITYERLLRRLEFLDYIGEGTIYLDSVKELEELQGASTLEKGREKRLSEIGFSDGGTDVFQNIDYKSNKNAEFEILNYWEDNRRCMTINRQKTIYEGPSPYWRHRKKPFVIGRYDRLPNEFNGISAVKIIADLQDEENTIHNQRTDNVNFVINRMWKVRRGADIDESELVSRPHGIVHVDRPEDVDEFAMEDVAASSFNQQNIISTVMENTLATPPVIRGAEGRGDKTATETLKQTSNAGMRFDIKMKLFESLSVERLAYLMDMNNQQFIEDKRIIRLGPEKSMQWREIKPGEFIGEYDYRPASANIDPAANKQVRREQLTQMMQFLIQSKVPFVNYMALFKEWLESFDVENAEKFLLNQQELQQMMSSMGGGQQGQTASQEIENARTGRSRGRQPQTERNPTQQASGEVK